MNIVHGGGEAVEDEEIKKKRLDKEIAVLSQQITEEEKELENTQKMKKE